MDTSGAYVAAIGMFDGVHRGHEFLIEALTRYARDNGLRSMVITFPVHPLTLIAPEKAPALISTPREKSERLRALGVDTVLMLDFDEALRRRPGRDFLIWLRENHRVEALIVGFDNHFGADRLTAAQAAELEPLTGVKIIPLGCFVAEDDRTPCSTLLRAAIAEGRMDDARRIAGRPYAVSGTVVHGRSVGRTIGFPTANIVPGRGVLMPPAGVYAVDVHLPDGSTRRGMTNIGTRPTFGDSAHTTFEVNIFDFSADIYGSTLRVDFLARLRDEMRFGSADSLRRQLEEDRTRACLINY